jgi:hypothetical protein
MVDHLTKRFGERTAFQEVSFSWDIYNAAVGPPELASASSPFLRSGSPITEPYYLWLGDSRSRHP